MQFGSRTLSLETPRVMGVLNVTPDSFYDGGAHYQSKHISVDSCLHAAETMLLAGADFIDVGGESTRPRAEKVGLQQEMDRVLPVVEAISRNLNLIISVDTSSPEIMVEAANLGAGLINDVRALERPNALDAAAGTEMAVCLMHMQGTPESMQSSPSYKNAVDDVKAYLRGRAEICINAGIRREQILVDPGIGFGKTDQHNLALLAAVSEFDLPVLVGVSRKSMIGRLLERDVDQRLAGSLAFAMDSLQRGARIIRVHDVAETVDMVKVFNLMRGVSA